MEIQWPLVIFSLLAGCGGATLAFAGLSTVLSVGEKARVPAVICALVLLVAGGCASVLHLGQPANIMAAATNIFSFSGISIELIMLGLNVVVAIVFLVLARGENAGGIKVVGVVGLVTGLVMAFAVGNGYVMVAQPAWNTPVLPLAYLGSGLAMGATLFAALMVGTKADTAELKKVIPYVVASALVQTVAFLAYAFVIGFAVDALLFWGGALLVGSIGAVVCAALMSKTPNLAYAAVVCAVIGGICFRALMWLVGTGYLDLFSLAATYSVLGL